MVATKRDPRVMVAPAYRGERRVNRYPEHRAYVEFRPWQLQPFLMAPVLPGETLTNLLLQGRCVTKPLHEAMKLQGWWLEYWFFYVKHRDLAEGTVRDTVTNMVLNPATDMTALRNVAGNPLHYTYPGAIDWTSYCLQRVTEEYFREEGEAWDAYTIEGLPQVAIWGRGHSDWSEGLTLNAAKRADYLDVDLDEARNPSEFEERWAHWQALRDAGLMQMDYEDFVNTYGAQTREEEKSPNLHRPELMRYVRSWQYPTNVVEATTGVPAVAVAWSVAERSDKQFRFNEPGFICGYTTVRPKPYQMRQQGALVGALDNVHAWLPAVTNDHYENAYKQFAETAGPLEAIIPVGAASYWVDLRDLYIHGDQFVRLESGNITANGAITVNTPTATGNRAYAESATDPFTLFKGGTPALQCVQMDCTCSLTIKGRQRDRTPGAPI